MFVLDLSAPTADHVPALAAAVADLPGVRPPERVRGGEALVLAARADHALTLVLRVLELGTWRIGLGVGDAALPPGAEVRAGTGGAFAAAEQALAASRRAGAAPVAVRAADERHAGTARDAEAVLGLVAWMIRTRSRGQWRVVRALRERPGATQAQLAEHLGITQQTVSRALRTSGWREESAAHDLVERLLAMIDLTTAREGARTRRAVK